jgi:hypothetical protein
VIVLPNRIRLDTHAPSIVPLSVHVGRRLITVRYRVNEPARGLLYVGGKVVVRTHRYSLAGRLRVSVSFLRDRRLAGPLAVGADDLAGNVSRPRVVAAAVPQGKA